MVDAQLRLDAWWDRSFGDLIGGVGEAGNQSVNDERRALEFIASHDVACADSAINVDKIYSGHAYHMVFLL